MNNQLNWKKFSLAGMMVLCTFFGAAQVNLDSGLVAHYPFNGNANDESGNSFDGTVFGATLTSDRFGLGSSAYSFDGIDDYINVPGNSTFNGPTSFSVSVWFNSNQTAARTKIINKGIDVGGDRSLYTWDITLNPAQSGSFLGQVRGNYSDGVSSVSLYSEDTTLFNNWNFVVLTYDGLIGKCYVNNVLQDSSMSISGTLNNESGPIQIGRENNSNTGSDEFSGKIDDIRIYNRVLNPQEIDSLYNQSLNVTDIAEFNNFNISLFPNPANGAFTLRSPKANIQSLLLYDLTGRDLRARISRDQNAVQVQTHYHGLAIVKVQTDQGIWIQKVRIK